MNEFLVEYKTKDDDLAATELETITSKDQLSDYYLELGLSKINVGTFDDAKDDLKRSLLLDPQDPVKNFYCGLSHHKTNDFSDAAGYYKRAVAAKKNFPQALNNLGNVYRSLGNLVDAEKSLRRALQILPLEPTIHLNHGVVLQELGNNEQAMSAYDRAISLDPVFAEARKNRALLCLKMGNLRAGFDQYEWRWRTREFLKLRAPVNAPRWNGERSAGLLLVWAEQGIGDAIHFIRYAPLVKERLVGKDGRKGRLIVAAPSSLSELFERVEGVDQVCSPKSVSEDCDWQIPILSIPRVLNTSFNTIPCPHGYLQPTKNAIRKWSSIKSIDLLKVGLVWSGDRQHKNNFHRSISADVMAPIVRTTGVKVYLLQVGQDSKEGSSLVRLGAVHVGRYLDSFNTTAGLISNLDLVISVDTSTGHLAAAMNTPVWLLISRIQDWRWFEKSEESPWYPSARLFRQEKFGEWNTVISEVVCQLKEMVKVRMALTKT